MDKTKTYESICDELRRIQVPGGWIYESWRYSALVNEWEPFSTVFVPEPEISGIALDKLSHE